MTISGFAMTVLGVLEVINFFCGILGYGIHKEYWREHFEQLKCNHLGYTFRHEFGCWFTCVCGMWGLAYAVIREYSGQGNKMCFRMPRELKLSYRFKLAQINAEKERRKACSL